MNSFDCIHEMPTAFNSVRKGTKRAATDGDRKHRKMKRPRDEAKSSEEQVTDTLEKQILQDRKHYNHITHLLERARNPDTSREALYALCRVFCNLLASGALGNSSASSENEVVVEQWLSSRLDDVWGVVADRLPALSLEEQKHGLKLSLQLLKEEALSLRVSQTKLFKKRSTSIFTSLATASSHYLSDFYTAQYALKYVDLAYALVYGIQQSLPYHSNSEAISASIRILEAMGEAQPDSYWTTTSSAASENNKREAITAKSLTKAIGDAWLVVMGRPLDKAQRKTVLRLTPTKIAPMLRKSERLLDFLADSFDAGGSTALLAISGLFDLIQAKNLDYPQFYRKVYSMLDASILHSKHRSSFLRLLDTFLASSHLPAALIASFVKRLARLSLFAPPAAIAFVVPLVYNLLREHPACTFMIHRVPAMRGASSDPFDMSVDDPTTTGALASSLWEIHALEAHYHPNIAIIARVLSEPFTKPAFSVEEFLDHSYASVSRPETCCRAR